MELFPGLAIIIVVLLAIIIIIIVAVAVNNGTKNAPIDNICTTQSDCKQGFVCVHDTSTNTNICKAGLGIICNSDADCTPDLICDSISKVCSVGATSTVSQKTSYHSRKLHKVPVPETSKIICSNAIPLNTTDSNIMEINAETPNNIPLEIVPLNIISSELPTSNNIVSDAMELGTEIIVPDAIVPDTIVPDTIVPDIIVPDTIVPNITPNIIIPNIISSNTKDIVSHNLNGEIAGLNIIELGVKSNIIATQSPTKLDILSNTPITGSPMYSGKSVRKPTRRMVIRGDQSVTPLTGTNPNNNEVIPNIIPRAGRRNESYLEGASIDNELNSGGDYSDAPFDIRSAETTKDVPIQKEYPITSVSSPCEERDGVYYCRNNKNETISDVSHSPVIDVCSYSNATVFLLDDGNIICEINSSETKQRHKTFNNIRLSKITSFNGYLYGIGVDKNLYTLPNNLFPTTNWIWTLAEWAPKCIEHISSTHDSTHLWMQTLASGYLYSSPNKIVLETSHSGLRRVYGRNIDHYIDINPVKYTATIYPGKTVFHNIYDGALSYYDEVIAIHPSESSEYKGISIVNWRPYYIRM